MKDTSPARCARHLEALAGWRCDSCQAALCPDCVLPRRSLSAEYLACGVCNERAGPILVHRSYLPLAWRLRTVWRYPFTVWGMAVLVGLSAVLMVLRWAAAETFLLLKWLPTVLWLGVFWGAFFSVVRSTARGERELDTPDYSDVFADCVAPAVRGFVGTSVLWLPGLLYLLHVKEWDVRKPVNELLDSPSFYVTGGLPTLDWSQVVGDPLLWGIVLLGALWVPLQLVLAAAGSSLTQMLNPVAVLVAARRLGWDYVLTLGALAVLTGAMVLGHGLAAGLRWLDLALLSPWGAEFITCLAPLLMARVLGLLLYTRGDELGYGEPATYLEPVLGNTPPSVALRSMREHLDAPAESPAEATSPMDETITALVQAVEAQDAGKALALYPQLPEPRFAKRVAPEHHLFVGQAAAAQGQYALAVRALESAADVAPDGPTASRALVLQARVYAERLREPERAANIYRYVVHRYPDTDASRFARQHLPPTS